MYNFRCYYIKMQHIKTPLDAIKRAVEIAGGQTSLAKRIGIPQPYVSQWLYRNKQVGPRFVIPVEKAVDGKVTRHQLRPDIYPEEK